MSGDVVARASRLTAGVEAGQWDVVREQGEFYGVYKGEFGRRVAGLIYDRREAEFIAATRTLVPELIEELEMQTSLQGLSVQIPEYGEWGSETLLCLFQDFGIQPGDGYQEASSRQGDLLRALAAANAEVEKLRTEADDLKLHASNTSIEVEKLRRGGKELGRIIERQCLDVLEITGLHHMIDADGDGDWGVVWERLAEMAAAGAEVEKLRGALETIRCIANKAAGVGWRDVTSQSCDEAAGMQSVGEEILAAIERAGIEP